MLHEEVDVVRAAEDLWWGAYIPVLESAEVKKGTEGKRSGKRRGTYARRKVQPQRNRARDTALSGAVGTDDHVEVGTGFELDIVVGHEVVQLDADDGAGDVAVVNIMEMGEY